VSALDERGVDSAKSKSEQSGSGYERDDKEHEVQFPRGGELDDDSDRRRN
jgi:hypothetical protein